MKNVIDFRCPVCKSSNWSKWALVSRIRWAERCDNCGLFRLAGADKASPGRDEFAGLDMQRYRLSMEGLRTRSFGRVLSEAERLTDSRTLLDIGCGLGWMLDVARMRGWDAWGIEPSSSAVKEVRDRGHQVIEGLFPHQSVEGRLFGAVTLMDVFEHLADPAAILREIRHVLAPSGLVIFKVPNSEGPLYRLAGLLSQLSGGWFSNPLGRMYQVQFAYPHLFYFNPSTLTRLLEQSGYRVRTLYQENIIERQGLTDRILYSACSRREKMSLWCQAVAIRLLLHILAFWPSRDIFTIVADAVIDGESALFRLCRGP